MIDKYLHFLLIRSKNFQYWFDTTCVLVNKHKINMLKFIYFQSSFSHNLKLTKLDDATDFQAGGSDLVWYSIDRDIFKTESIFSRKDKSIQLDLGSVYLDLYSLLIPDIK